ncbi:MAG: four helix bundle protein [Spirochaetes bacterium]|nr:four helix bundle protein [Spirochaetota bacterium]
MKENVLKDKSYVLAIEIVMLCKKLAMENKEYALFNQLLKSGTSIGANIREAEFAQSKADFINKMSISLKEAAETEYWIMLLRDTLYISADTSRKMLELVIEIIKILISTVKNSKNPSI